MFGVNQISKLSTLAVLKNTNDNRMHEKDSKSERDRQTGRESEIERERKGDWETTITLKWS